MYINHLQPDLVEADDFESFVDKLDRIPFYEQTGQSCFLTSFANALAVIGSKEVSQDVYKQTEKLYVAQIEKYIKNEIEFGENKKVYTYKDFVIYVFKTFFQDDETDEEMETFWYKEIQYLNDNCWISEWKNDPCGDKEYKKEKTKKQKENYVKKLLYEYKFNGGQASKSFDILKNRKLFKENINSELVYKMNKSDFLLEIEKKEKNFSNANMLKNALKNGVAVTSCMNYMSFFDSEDPVYDFKNNLATKITGHSIACFAYVKIDKKNYFVFIDSNDRSLNKCENDIDVYNTWDLGNFKNCVQNIVFLEENKVLNMQQVVDNKKISFKKYVDVYSNGKKSTDYNYINIYEIITLSIKSNMEKNIYMKETELLKLKKKKKKLTVLISSLERGRSRNKDRKQKNIDKNKKLLEKINSEIDVLQKELNQLYLISQINNLSIGETPLKLKF